MRHRPTTKVRAGAAFAFTLIVGVAALRGCSRLPDRYPVLLDTRYLTSREHRLLRSFGECEPGGYGYLKRILAIYSRVETDPTRRPAIRYRDYDRRSEYLFEPTRFEVDPSVLVGVGLRESDMTEGEVCRAERRADGTWRLPLQPRFDLLTRIDVELAPEDTGTTGLRVFRHEGDSTPLVSWAAPNSFAVGEFAGARERRLQFVATPPIRRAAFRDAYQLAIQVNRHVSVRRIRAYGVVINMGAFRTVHRQGACFTAVRRGHDERVERFSRAVQELND